jgi:hypothetical protein
MHFVGDYTNKGEKKFKILKLIIESYFLNIGVRLTKKRRSKKTGYTEH